ncbi:MAG TPA: histidine phosphatase family protein [Myxococcota bacterium]|nr:histidine phosphatase family protein [Myxococcota bacterium]
MKKTERSPGGRRVAGLVRHGHFDRPEQLASAHLPLPLSERGRRQAREAAGPILRHCEELGIELDPRIEASQLLRAWETATLLAEELEARTGVAFVVEERLELIERGLGSCANLRFDEIESQLARDPRVGPLPEDWRRRSDFRLPVPGAESLMMAGARAASRIATSLRSIPEEDPRDVLRLFVAHGGCLRHAAVQLGTLDVRTVTGLTMDYAQAVLIETDPRGGWLQTAGEWKKRLPKSQSFD